MNRNCPLCHDVMTACYLTNSESGHLKECHGMDKVIGTSVNRSPLETRVCVGCGYVASFATDPSVFRAEANRARGALPIPALPELRPLKPDPALPLPADAVHPPEEDTADVKPLP